MCAHGQAKLGFYPLPLAEADRLKNWLYFSEQFSALDPCVGDGIEFAHLLRDAPVRRYGIEIDAFRAEQARAPGIDAVPLLAAPRSHRLAGHFPNNTETIAELILTRLRNRL